MDKELKYNGYSAVPSDYEANDGDLALSLNLIPEDGALKPIKIPDTPILSVEQYIPVYIHQVSYKKNYIFADSFEDGFTLFFIIHGLETSLDDMQLIGHFSGELKSITSIGNTLIVASASGLCYCLWHDGGYIQLGSKPPFVSIEFGMRQEGEIKRVQDCKFPEVCCNSYNTERASNEDTRAQFESVTQMVYGLLLPTLTEISNSGWFYQPFFIRYAYRLFDGTHSWHSAPVLMLPNVLPPLIKYSETAGPDSDHNIPVRLSLAVDSYSLYYKISRSEHDSLQKWSDIISGIDFFISAPIYTFDQSKNLSRRLAVNLWTICNSLESSVFEDSDSRADGMRPGQGQTGGGASGNIRPGGTSRTSTFVGHYFVGDGVCADHALSPSITDSQLYIRLPLNTRFFESIRDAHDFYKIATLPIEKITDSESKTTLPLLMKDLTNLQVRPTLTDDYRSHCNLIPQHLYVYNTRLHMANISIEPAKPFPIRSAVESFTDSSTGSNDIVMRVWTRIDGVRCKIEGILEHVDQFSFPRYIFYPDASAYKLEVELPSLQKRYTVNLTPHDFLNGAYYLGDIFAVDTTPDNASSELDALPSSIAQTAKIYVSEAGNPYCFSPLGIYTVGSGTMLGLSTGAKALSQGQFGQFPLYAFTTEGVWAMELTSTGTYSARQPITRDVCINPDAITQLDSSVLFPTDRGIMLISGSQTQSISDAINSEHPFDLIKLPGISKLHAMMDHDSSDGCLPLLSFSEFLRKCRMIYDYVHQRVIVYAPKVSYAYVFSLKSQEWGMVYSNIESHLNSYPEAIAVDADGNLINLSRHEESDVKCLYVTRPLKLDAPNVHKTIDTVIQRGYFRKGSVATVLYGSRDMENWHLIWSSTDHYLRGFRGSPYKYFRIAGIATLAPDENIYGASVQFTPRLVNQPR